MKTKSEYKKVASHEAKKGEFEKCLLLYSGGLDTSVMLKWIQDNYQCEVVTLTVDIGQTADDLTAITKKAKKLGAVKTVVYDAKKEFANNILSEAIKANAEYQGGYALSCPLGRVMISEVAVKIAKQEKCTVIAHGATGKGNDQVRFESYITTLDPKMKIIAPVREWSMGRDEEIEYAKNHNIPVIQTKESPYSYDENMWGNTGEGGEIEDPRLVPPLKRILQWSRTAEDAPNKAETLKITFEEGLPTKLNGKKMPLDKMIAECNKIGGKHAVGTVHLIEDRIVGLKVRGIYENPGARILINAHQHLERLVSTRQENEFKTQVDTMWAYLTYGAEWYEPVMDHLRAFIESQNKKVSGVVTMSLYKGSADAVAVDSPYSLFDHNLATFNKSKAFNQNAAAGFIELWSLPPRTAYNVAKKNKTKSKKKGGKTKTKN